MNFRRTAVWFLAAAFLLSFAPALKAQESGKININQATVEELTQLKGIGETLAERIVKYREENGPFKSVDELMHVKGIGPKTFEAIKDNIAVK